MEPLSIEAVEKATKKLKSIMKPFVDLVKEYEKDAVYIVITDTAICWSVEDGDGYWEDFEVPIEYLCRKDGIKFYFLLEKEKEDALDILRTKRYHVEEKLKDLGNTKYSLERLQLKDNSVDMLIKSLSEEINKLEAELAEIDSHFESP